MSDSKRPSFGVPYARVEIEGNREVKVCPVCGERIVSVERKDFESFSGSEYARHYIAEHEQAEAR